MPPKTVNETKVFFMTSDGQKISLDGIPTIEPEFDNDIDYSQKMFSDETFEFKGTIVFNPKNDRNRKSKRYRKNRKGYRGLCDLLI